VHVQVQTPADYLVKGSGLPFHGTFSIGIDQVISAGEAVVEGDHLLYCVHVLALLRGWCHIPPVQTL
jgi:hypothetical protein